MPEEIKKSDAIKWIKDGITIIVFLATVAGWLISNASRKAVFDVTIERHEMEIQQLNEKLDIQAELNGKIIQYMIEDND